MYRAWFSGWSKGDTKPVAADRRQTVLSFRRSAALPGVSHGSGASATGLTAFSLEDSSGEDSSAGSFAHLGQQLRRRRRPPPCPSARLIFNHIL
jgi:hypothetical protein